MAPLFFAALADRFAGHEERRKKLEIMRDIEVLTAERMKPLVARLGLAPANSAALESAARNAAAQVTEWAPFVEAFRKAAPGFVAKFEDLAAAAPAQDRAIAEFLLEHELAFVAFTEEESAGKPDSVGALRALLVRCS